MDRMDVAEVGRNGGRGGGYGVNRYDDGSMMVGGKRKRRKERLQRGLLVFSRFLDICMLVYRYGVR